MKMIACILTGLLPTNPTHGEAPKGLHSVRLVVDSKGRTSRTEGRFAK